MRAVFDTNVVVSALVFGSRLAWLRRAWTNGSAVPVVCRETVAELLRVLHYPKFHLNSDERSALLEEYLLPAEVVEPTIAASALSLACRERDDVVFLRLAGSTDVPLVSGDADITVLQAIAPVQILRAAEFHALLRHRR